MDSISRGSDFMWSAVRKGVHWCKANGYAEALVAYQLDERSRQLGRLWTLDDFDLFSFPPAPVFVAAGSAADMDSMMDIEGDELDKQTHANYERECEEVVEKNLNFVAELEKYLQLGSSDALCEVLFNIIELLQRDSC